MRLSNHSDAHFALRMTRTQVGRGSPRLERRSIHRISASSFKGDQGGSGPGEESPNGQHDEEDAKGPHVEGQGVEGSASDRPFEFTVRDMDTMRDRLKAQEAGNEDLQDALAEVRSSSPGVYRQDCQ